MIQYPQIKPTMMTIISPTLTLLPSPLQCKTAISHYPDRTPGWVVARLVWKSEMAHSSGELFNHEPATRQGGHRRNAPWASIPGLEEGRLTGERARWAS